MHTTGLADETIVGLYERERLTRALRDARARTLAIYGHLDLARPVPQLDVVNPPPWELAHIAWFQEHWCLRWSRQAGALRKPSMLAVADALFDSTRIPHAVRWSLPYPPLQELRGYIDATFDATLDALAATPEDERYFFALALLHEDMHGEALLMTLQALGLPGPAIDCADPPASRPMPKRDVAFAGGEFEQGTRRSERGFVFDNEKWSHPRRVAPFRMADRPVTVGEFAAFVDDGGYGREDLWSVDGWEWRKRTARIAPTYWRREGSQWQARLHDRWLPIDPHAPMVHVCLHEALAYCRWAGRRLPTESEWEFAARAGGRDIRYPWGDEEPNAAPGLDYRYRGPSTEPADPRDGPTCAQMIGGVWEWTSSPFAPYPGFRADPYKEYSEPWFHSHYVLRGGSFATRGRLVHSRFRNFYLADRADVFAGFRTCAVE